MSRKCGKCTLCCRLLPIEKEVDRTPIAEDIKKLFDIPPNALPDFHKPAGFKCPHQHFGGCRVYDKRPMGCRLWSCRWLVEDDTAEMRRPDRVGYVIDMMPDIVQANYGTEGKVVKLSAVQIWIDPKRKDDWRDDQQLWDYMARRGKENGMISLLRFNSYDAKVIFPPALSDDGQWHEIDDSKMVRERRGRVK